MFYMSGVNYPDSILAVCPQHPNPDYREILFVEQNTSKKAIWEGCKYTQESIKEISGISTILWTSDFEPVLRDLMYYAHTVYIDMQESTKFVPEVKSRSFRYANRIKSDYPLHPFNRLFPLLADIRLVKTYYEIEQIRNACNITEKAFSRVTGFIKPGIWEYEVEAEITHELIRNKALHAFAPIVASGKNACALHYVDNHSICKDGDLLLLDFGAEYGNYASDLSRTIPVSGRFTSRQKQVYDACFRVYEYTKTLFIPGMSISKVYKKTCAVMEQELIGLGLFSQMNLDGQAYNHELMRRYFMHNVSHFVGLDVHDVGSVDTVFEEGMILSCEPGIYIPEEGIGVRLETMMMVSSLPVDLMEGIPVSSDDIERLMQSAYM